MISSCVLRMRVSSELVDERAGDSAGMGCVFQAIGYTVSSCVVFRLGSVVALYTDFAEVVDVIEQVCCSVKRTLESNPVR